MTASKCTLAPYMHMHDIEPLDEWQGFYYEVSLLSRLLRTIPIAFLDHTSASRWSIGWSMGGELAKIISQFVHESMGKC